MINDMPALQSSEPPARRSVCDEIDRALLAAGTGDRAAFAELYDATCAGVFGLALHMLHDQELSERTVIDSYLEAWRRAPLFAPHRHSAISWILLLTYRQAKATSTFSESAHEALPRR